MAIHVKMRVVILSYLLSMFFILNNNLFLYKNVKLISSL